MERLDHFLVLIYENNRLFDPVFFRSVVRVVSLAAATVLQCLLHHLAPIGYPET